MKISKSDLEWAAKQGCISTQQANSLWDLLLHRPQGNTLFNLTNVLFYAGAIIALLAMSIFLGNHWDSFSSRTIFFISLGYSLLFLIAGHLLWKNDSTRIPGGLLITLAVALTPLTVYSLENYFDWWPSTNPGNYRDFYAWIKGGWFLMELVTIIVGAVAIYFYRFPLLSFLIYFSLWFMSMDVTPLIYSPEHVKVNQQSMVSVSIGLSILIVSFFIDRYTKEDFAFWGYLFGLLAFWGGLTAMDKSSELWEFFYLLVNIGLILVALILDRKVFIIFGALGVVIYLGHLAWNVFGDTVLFPFILSGFGIAIIILGIVYQKNHQRLANFVNRITPSWLRNRPEG